MPRSRPAAVPLTERDYAALREIDREHSDWKHTVNWGLDYQTARGQAGAAEDDTGVAYSVFVHKGQYGVSPTKWLTRSWLRKGAGGRAPARKPGLLARLFRIPNPARGGVQRVQLIAGGKRRPPKV